MFESYFRTQLKKNMYTLSIESVKEMILPIKQCKKLDGVFFNNNTLLRLDRISICTYSC